MKLHKKDNFSRRNFLKTTVLASGGLLIGFNLLTACKPGVKMPVDIASLNFNDFNAFIQISDEGYVTIFSPNPEIGQGVKTSMPMIIAEELDVDWNNVTVAQGILDTNNYTRQVAGGSQSIRFSWDALRQTGATAKQMLVNAAALKWNVDAATLKASKGVITNLNGDLLGYGEKQDDDLLHNYTIGKATIDCNFELNSPYYQCHEIENGVRVAFIACSYHCG